MSQVAKELKRKPPQTRQRVLPQQLWAKLKTEQQEVVWQRLLRVCQQHLQSREVKHEP